MVAIPRRTGEFGPLPAPPLKPAGDTLAAVAATYRGGEWRRDHLGASTIGRACARSVWLAWRWTVKPDHSARLLRLFQRGHREEAVIVAELRRAGLEVWDADPETGRQWAFTDETGHFSGSADGVALGVLEAPREPHLLEFKTHSDKSFADLVKRGVRASKPEHFAQMQVYMRFLDLKRALYIAVNKNDDQIWAERIDFDVDIAARLVERAQSLVRSPAPPPRLPAGSPECRFCDFSGVCHDGRPIERSCRTCSMSAPAKGGGWWCGRHDRALDPQDQRTGCDDYQRHEEI